MHFANGKSEGDQNDSKGDPKDPTATPADNKTPKELPLLEMKPQNDFNELMTFKSEKELPQLKPPPDLPILTLKPPENKDDNDVIDSNRIVITINSCDTNGVVNGFTIKMPKES